MRVGIGYDVHRFAEGRKLILGGVEIPYEKGLDGHSDADVLTHAIIDALLGASGNRDIGTLFPDTDDTYQNISSIELLRRVFMVMKTEGYSIVNIDSVVICEQPKVMPYAEQMKACLAEALEIHPSAINIKAKTEEGLGFTGHGEGMKAEAVCLLDGGAFPENYA